MRARTAERIYILTMLWEKAICGLRIAVALPKGPVARNTANSSHSQLCLRALGIVRVTQSRCGLFRRRVTRPKRSQRSGCQLLPKIKVRILKGSALASSWPVDIK